MKLHVTLLSRISFDCRILESEVVELFAVLLPPRKYFCSLGITMKAPNILRHQCSTVSYPHRVADSARPRRRLREGRFREHFKPGADGNLRFLIICPHHGSEPSPRSLSTSCLDSADQPNDLAAFFNPQRFYPHRSSQYPTDRLRLERLSPTSIPHSRPRL